MPASSPQGRGGGWVLAQSLLMSALVAAGPLDTARWHRPWLVVCGAVLFLLAAAVGIAGVVHLGDNRTPFPAPRLGSRLVRTGIYAHLRHPLYASVLTWGFAWALLWQSAAALALAVLQIPFFMAKASSEELRLRAQFKDYPEYARRVKRFLPGLF